MSILIDKAGFTAQMHKALLSHAALAGTEVDGMRLLQLLAGVLTETLLLFDDPDEGLGATRAALVSSLGCIPREGKLGEGVLPPAWAIDAETEQGRGLARGLFE